LITRPFQFRFDRLQVPEGLRMAHPPR
jgi:hypothetical protein